MAPATPRLKILSVGGNAVSAFLSWRLQATNACDVTLVWKSGFDNVYQYGISFKSESFGNERFKPRQVVRTPEEASHIKDGPFDYVILCIKALPDVYDIGSVIDSVVTPQHTCILLNTTHTLGIENAIEERFPTNVVLSLVSNADLTQTGASEFEHKGSTEIWVGPANANKNIPASIQEDMAQALAMTLSTGNVECKMSANIRQQQFERVIGPIAFHPLSVMHETPTHAALLEKTGAREAVLGIIDELIHLAEAQGCKFSEDFKDSTIKEQCRPLENGSIMWQDFMARRPMEVETYLGSPIKLAQAAGVKVPAIATLYTLLHDKNIKNQQRPKEPVNGFPAPPGSPSAAGPMPRMSSNGPPPPRNMGPNGAFNGNGMGRPPPRPRNSSNYAGPPPGMRRGPPVSMNGAPNGYRPPMNGGPNGHAGSRQPSRRGSMEESDLNEFSHLVLYDELAADGAPPDGVLPPVDGQELSMREKQLQLRERELALREREMRMARGPPGPPGPPGARRRPPPSIRGGVVPGFEDDDEEDDYFDPNASPNVPMIDPDNFDMMSVTSRKNRKTPQANPSQLRADPEMGAGPQAPNSSRASKWRPGFGRNRSSQIMHASIPGLHNDLMNDPLMSMSSNRYADVDRAQMHAGSRANSLTAQHLDQLNGPGQMAGMSGPFPRRASQSPGQHPYSPSIRGGNGRPSPPNGMNGRPSPPDGMRAPVPRYPPGQGTAVAPHQVEQRVGVSALQPPKPKNVRSLTGSASNSAGSGDSLHDSTPSAHSSTSSLGPRPPIGVR